MKARAIFPFYDFKGSLIVNEDELPQMGFKPTFPMKTYLESYIVCYYKTLKALQEFLKECKYISDNEQFHRKDYWETPNEFESQKEGDCEDFALYTWRQLLHMGYEARFVVGKIGDNKGHAWCTARIKNRNYIIEPLQAKLPFMPTLFIEKYQPSISVSFEYGRAIFYRHYTLNKKGSIIYKLLLVTRFVVLIIGIIGLFSIVLIPKLILKAVKKAITFNKNKYLF